MRFSFRGHEAFMVALGLLMEAGVQFQPVGGNEVEVQSLAELDDEQWGELAKLHRGPLPPEPTEPPKGRRPQPRGKAPTRDGTALTELVPDESTVASPPGAADDTEPGTHSVGDAPPRTGPGSSRVAWATYAEQLRLAGAPIEVTEDMSRDEIIEQVEALNSGR